MILQRGLKDLSSVFLLICFLVFCLHVTFIREMLEIARQEMPENKNRKTCFYFGTQENLS